uniref:Uncharacterized protein n=1 Tax=Arundo donax TaxID=35708 RepID=A0A0A9EZN3_ARUDO
MDLLSKSKWRRRTEGPKNCRNHVRIYVNSCADHLGKQFECLLLQSILSKSNQNHSQENLIRIQTRAEHTQGILHQSTFGKHIHEPTLDMEIGVESSLHNKPMNLLSFPCCK